MKPNQLRKISEAAAAMEKTKIENSEKVSSFCLPRKFCLSLKNTDIIPRGKETPKQTGSNRRRRGGGKKKRKTFPSVW